ncbi:TPA: hypothetical protein VCC33_003536 [Kluyvera cryocrescens]|nr:hypothetical protein [Kluyvera cryocrescens]
MSTVNYSNIYQAHLDTIHKVRSVPKMGAVSQEELSMVKNRAILITTLDVILARHRQKFGTSYNLLSGRAALIHLLIKLYKWPTSLIRQMTLEDVFIALHDELAYENLPTSFQTFLSSIGANAYFLPFDDFIDGEWNPDHAKEHLKMLVE